MAVHDPKLDQLFTALGDPTRRAILSRLAHGSATVSELADPHDMALPSFMGHLRKLEKSGLIETSKEGRIRTCTLLPEALAPARSWLDEQREIWEHRLDRMDNYILNLVKERQNGPESKN